MKRGLEVEYVKNLKYWYIVHYKTVTNMQFFVQINFFKNHKKPIADIKKTERQNTPLSTNPFFNCCLLKASLVDLDFVFTVISTSVYLIALLIMLTSVGRRG